MKNFLLRIVLPLLGSVIAAIIILVLVAVGCAAGLGSDYHPAPWEQAAEE